MRFLSVLTAVCLVAAASMLFTSCAGKDDPAVVVCKEFIKKAATGDKTLKDIIDFESVAARSGTTEQEVIKSAGAEKWNQVQDDTVQTIMEAFAPFKNNYSTAFKKFKVDETGTDYWIVSFVNPAKERRTMIVKNRNGKLRTYYYNR